MHTHAACSHAIQSVSTKNDAKEFISSLLLTQSALQLFRAVYVIFGATGGIGSDLAKRLLAADSKVILAADNGDKLSKLKEKLGGGETQEIDVMNSKQVCCFRACITAVYTRHGMQPGNAAFILQALLLPHSWNTSSCTHTHT